MFQKQKIIGVSKSIVEWEGKIKSKFHGHIDKKHVQICSHRLTTPQNASGWTRKYFTVKTDHDGFELPLSVKTLKQAKTYVRNSLNKDQ